MEEGGLPRWEIMVAIIKMHYVCVCEITERKDFYLGSQFWRSQPTDLLTPFFLAIMAGRTQGWGNRLPHGWEKKVKKGQHPDVPGRMPHWPKVHHFPVTLRTSSTRAFGHFLFELQRWSQDKWCCVYAMVGKCCAFHTLSKFKGSSLLRPFQLLLQAPVRS